MKDFLANSISEITCRNKIKRIFRKILLHQEPEKPYSRFGYFMYHKFEFFVANDFKEKQKDAVLRFSDLFKRMNSNGKILPLEFQIKPLLIPPEPKLSMMAHNNVQILLIFCQSIIRNWN